MAVTQRWQGKAAAVAQVNTLAFTGTWKGTDTVTMTIGSKTVVYTLPADDTATNVAAAVAAAWTALSATVYPEFAEVTAVAATATITLTAVTAGKPFTATLQAARVGGSSSAAIAGGTSASAGTAATANSGPNCWDTAANWSNGTVPANTDLITIDKTDDDILYGLDQHGVTLASLTLAADFTGTLGLPVLNTDGTSYYEYRPQYLQIIATAANIGKGTAFNQAGARRCKIDFYTGQTTCIVFTTGSSLDDLESCLLKGSHASNALTIFGGEVGIAVFAGETSTLGVTLTVDGGGVRCGSGVTCTTVAINGGRVELNSAVGTSLTMVGGSVSINGSGAVAQLTMSEGATCAYNTTGTLGGATAINSGSFLTFDGDPRAKTVTNPLDFNGGSGSDARKVVSGLVTDWNNQAPAFNFGTNLRLTRGATA